MGNTAILDPADIDREAQQDMSDLEDRGDVSNPVCNCPKAIIEYGVFFDGTGNNADNYLLGIGKRENGEKTSGSYNNDITNVNKLFKSYIRDDKSEQNIIKVRESSYIQGIGTSAGSSDSATGSAFGAGSTGVDSRVKKAFDDLKNFIRNQSAGNTIKEIKIDVFGFSRGAAAARHFTNMVNQGYYKLTQTGKVYLNKESYEGAEEIVPKDKIKIRFLGLFDTVVSTTLDVDDDDYGDLMIGLNGNSAERIYHLTAAHEYRNNFCLTSANPGSGAIEIAVPGAHSDVGGGYAAHNHECAYVDNIQLVGLDALSKSRRQEAISAKKKELGAKYVAQGWIKTSDVEDAILLIPNGDMIGGYEVFLHRPWVDHRLSRVSLHLMYEAALEKGVPFTAILPNNDDYNIPPELKPLKAILSANGAPSALLLSSIQRNYVHHSSNITEKVASFIKPHAPREGNVRAVFANNAGEAK